MRLYAAVEEALELEENYFSTKLIEMDMGDVEYNQDKYDKITATIELIDKILDANIRNKVTPLMLKCAKEIKVVRDLRKGGW